MPTEFHVANGERNAQRTKSVAMPKKLGDSRRGSIGATRINSD